MQASTPFTCLFFVYQKIRTIGSLTFCQANPIWRPRHCNHQARQRQASSAQLLSLQAGCLKIGGPPTMDRLVFSSWFAKKPKPKGAPGPRKTTHPIALVSILHVDTSPSCGICGLTESRQRRVRGFQCNCHTLGSYSAIQSISLKQKHEHRQPCTILYAHLCVLNDSYINVKSKTLTPARSVSSI